MIDFLQKLVLALAPIAVQHALDVRKAKVLAAAPNDADASFTAYVARRR